MLLIDFFDQGVRRGPTAPCLTEPGGRSLSYEECAGLSHRIANGLAAAGVAAGENVGLLGPNHLLTMVAILGTVRSPAVWLPVNARNALSENIHILKSGSCRFLFLHSIYAPHLAEIRAALPSLVGVICVDGDIDGAPGLETWAARQSPRPVVSGRLPDDVVAIRGTGGTTGIPKGVMVTHRIYETLFANFFASMPLDAAPVHLVVAPLTHAAGAVCFAACAYGGETIVLPDTDPGRILSAIERYRVSLLFMPPTLIYRLLDHPDLEKVDCRSLQYFIYSAAPMSTDKLQRALEVFGPVMVQGYGQAEAPFFCTCLNARDHVVGDDPAARKRLSSCGRASPFARVEVMDDDGRLLGANQRGELVISGNLVMKGYYRNPEATALALVDGWLHTGDIGYRDEAGYYFIVDRKKDMIISGGFNIYPSEIEQVLWGHPAVRDCAVIGVPDEVWGEAVKAVVELRAGAAASTDELMAYCRERLGGMKTPKSVEIWPELPRSAIGKVLKKNVREQFWQGRESRI